MNNKTMSKTLLQSVKHHLILLIIFTSTYVSAESYDTNEYINLNNSICKNANKHLTLETSGFFEYIGAGKTKIFECGKTSNEPCRNNPELICRNIHKKHILHRSEALLIGINKFLDNTKKVKNRQKLKRAIKTQNKTNKQWASSNDILSLIDSLEKKIIHSASLLPPVTFSLINNELKLQHDQIREEILEEQRIAQEKQRIEKEVSLRKQKQKALEQEIQTHKQQEIDEQLEIMLYLLGILAIVVVAGTLTNKWIFFDTEKDFFMTLGLLASIATFLFMTQEYDYKQNITLSGDLFYWSITSVSILLSIWLMFKTYIISIKGNGFFVGTFIYLFKIAFSIIMMLFIFGKIGDVLNNKDGRTRANRAPALAILGLIAIFWKPIKSLLINGDKVREKREGNRLRNKSESAPPTRQSRATNPKNIDDSDDIFSDI
jgi:hypothetical protein